MLLKSRFKVGDWVLCPESRKTFYSNIDWVAFSSPPGVSKDGITLLGKEEYHAWYVVTSIEDEVNTPKIYLSTGAYVRIGSRTGWIPLRNAMAIPNQVHNNPYCYTVYYPHELNLFKDLYRVPSTISLPEHPSSSAVRQFGVILSKTRDTGGVLV